MARCAAVTARTVFQTRCTHLNNYIKTCRCSCHPITEDVQQWIDVAADGRCCGGKVYRTCSGCGVNHAVRACPRLASSDLPEHVLVASIDIGAFLSTDSLVVLDRLTVTMEAARIGIIAVANQIPVGFLIGPERTGCGGHWYSPASYPVGPAAAVGQTSTLCGVHAQVNVLACCNDCLTGSVGEGGAHCAGDALAVQALGAAH